MKVPARWRKVLGDLAATPFRTVLAVAAMAVGAFGLGTVLTARAVLTRELAATYRATRPAAAILSLDRASDEAVAAVRRLPGVGDAEARGVVDARLRVGPDEWAPLVLFVVRDFDDLRIDRFRREAGARPPADDEVLLERSSLPVARAGVGDVVGVRFAGGVERRLRVAGTVHAAGLAPGWMDHVVSGFVSWRSIARAAAPAERQSLRLRLDGDTLDRERIRLVAGRAAALLESRGQSVRRIEVPPPGRHPHADQMDTFLFLLGAFALLTLALGAVLAANTIRALLAEQVRQVGILKAIGASTGQVAALYLCQVAVLAAGGLAFGAPLGIAAGRGYARFAAGILNATILDPSLPVRVALIEVAAGFGVPLLAALAPVVRASRLTIVAAFGAGAGASCGGACGTRRLDRWLARIERLPRPLLWSLRSAIHGPGGGALAAVTLGLGGALFLAALNVSASWDRALAAEAAARRYDIDVRLSRPVATDRLRGLAASLPEVEHAEPWTGGACTLGRSADSAAPRVSLVGADAGSALLALPMIAGRWLARRDGAAVVINQALAASAPGLHAGGTLILRCDGSVAALTIVGVCRELSPLPAAYAPAPAVLAATGQPAGLARGMHVVTRRHDPAALLAAQRAIERAGERAGIDIAGMQDLADRRRALADHLVIVESALMLAAVLAVLVGGLGLATTLGIDVAGRTREIGILGALGATRRVIARCVVIEGLVLATASWGAALAAAMPATLVLDTVAGRIFIHSALAFTFSPRAAAAWLVLALAAGSLSSALPAWRAARLTLREALAHA